MNFVPLPGLGLAFHGQACQCSIADLLPMPTRTASSAVNVPDFYFDYTPLEFRPLAALSRRLGFRPSVFGLHSDFGLRSSDFLRISTFGLRICPP